ncbi:hypothetical protein [Bordetella bronchiseptica]|uniref:hypothetical protein n=1 Tax=Bordetella bronchiseptica TaxID=518 RepID=UPI000461727C|nr:hypothetical protein [Bordetella bronchiseptica]KDC48512.1 hypothetical protein L509_2848 [Bordetella bronchiseptica M85/00/2]
MAARRAAHYHALYAIFCARCKMSKPKPARGADAHDDPSLDQAKVLPPRGPVLVPNLPPKPPARAQADKHGPAVDNQTESNWADGAAPQPRARNARSSIF